MTLLGRYVSTYLEQSSVGRLFLDQDLYGVGMIKVEQFDVENFQKASRFDEQPSLAHICCDTHLLYIN